MIERQYRDLAPEGSYLLMMRRIGVVGVLFVAAVPTAYADGDLTPQPLLSTTVGIIAHTTKMAGLTESGLGPNVEIALGRERWQYYVEGAYSRVTIGPTGSVVDGAAVRGGGGVRWLARSFELGDDGAFEMTLEGFAGVQRFYWDGEVAAPVTRPDFGVGVGWQIRAFVRNHQFAMHVSTRVAYAPTERDRVTALCRGTCMMPTVATNTGLFVVAGARF